MQQTPLKSEIAFHDRWADSVPPEAVRVREAFEAPTALENRFVLKLIRKHMGGLSGLRLADVGCGLGESAVYFALEGARVTALDVSAGMLKTARAAAALYGTRIGAVAASAEELPLADGSADVVYTANTLHHLARPLRLVSEAERVLRPGGLFVAWDPLAYNPAINLYRRLARDVRTPDERPLRWEFVRRARAIFPGLRSRTFWLAALLLFVKYYAVDRLDPSHTRYWKRILEEPPERLRWWIPLRELDRLLTRIPLLRSWCWNVVLWGIKSRATCGAGGTPPTAKRGTQRD